MTAPARTDADLRSLNLWKALIALALLILLILCWLGVLGGMRAQAVMPTFTAPPSGNISAGSIAFAGTGAPNTKIGLFSGATSIGTAEVGADSKWSLNADLPTPGEVNLIARPLDAQGTALSGMDSSPLRLSLTAPSAFTAPKDNEELDAQSYVLEGTGTPGERLEVWQSTPDQPATLFATTLVTSDGKWNEIVEGSKPGTKPGTYTYELRAPGSGAAIAKRTVIVKAGLTSASNAKCPCKLRVFTQRNQNIKGATIILFKDGQQVQAGADPKLFGDLNEGEYTYSVSAPGYETYTAPSGKVRVPRNKNFEVYLKPIKR